MERKDQQHTRVNKIILGFIERPVLAWLAKRMPAWVTPDKLTLLGLFGTILTSISYYLTNFNPLYLWLASIGLVINWFGDCLDGTIARYRKIERPKYGFFVDHVMDGIGETLVVFGIALSPYVNFNVAMVALIGYLLMGNLVYITTFIRGIFRISYLGLGPTEVRVILIIMNALAFYLGNRMVEASWGVYSIYDYILMVLAVLLFGAFLVTSITTALELAQEEKLARREKEKQKEVVAESHPEPDGKKAPNID